MKSMSTNKVWDLDEIPQEAKTVGCKWSTRQNMTPRVILKYSKPDSWL